MSKITYEDLWDMQGMCTRLHELMPELLEEVVMLRAFRESSKEDDAEIKKLRSIVESARSALGYHPDSDIDIAAEIVRLRDQARDAFHKTTDKTFSAMRSVMFDGRMFVQLTDFQWYEDSAEGRRICDSPDIYNALTMYDEGEESTEALRMALGSKPKDRA